MTREEKAWVSPGPRTWTILLPPGLPLLNLNDRLHWAKAYRLREELKNAALTMLRAARVPQLDRVSVLVVYDPPPDWRDRDPDNIAASVKPLVDALRPPKTVKAGGKWVRVTSRAGYVLADDDSAHVAWVTCMIGQPFPADLRHDDVRQQKIDLLRVAFADDVHGLRPVAGLEDVVAELYEQGGVPFCML